MAPPNKNNKRTQVNNDKTVIFAIVSVAAFVAVSALVVSKGLWSQANYLSKVADKKEVAVKQLKENKTATAELETSYNTFKNQNPNLIGGSATGQGDRDGDNARLILDALPNKYDFPALATSLERMLTGYKVNGITGTDDILMQQTAGATGTIEIPFSVDVTANYDSIKQLISNLNKSIRPIQITKLDFKGTNDRLQVNISAKTFYQPEKGLEITEESVQ